MDSITITYTYKLTYTLEGFSDYCFASDKNLYNLKRNKLVRRIVNSSAIGYYLNGKFYSLKKLKPLLKPYKNDMKRPF